MVASPILTRKNPDLAPLSRSEWRIMNLCWRLGRCTARQVWEESRETRKRDYQTIKTQLDRITGKGYLTVEKLGPLCLYTPAVRRSRAVGSSSASSAARSSGGSGM